MPQRSTFVHRITQGSYTTPTTITNPDGSKTVVDSLPTPAQRIKLHTGGSDPLITLDVPITSSVAISANVGFLGVHLDGSLAECTTGTYDASTSPPSCGGTSSTHLLQVNLKTPTTAPLADSDGDISLPDFFTHLIAGGSGGVGIRLPLPCVEGEQLGSVAGLQTEQVPVNAPMSGYGVV